MKTFFDSSSFVKRYIQETGSDEIDEIFLNTSSLALSLIAIPEILSALCRRLREGFLKPADYALAKARLLEETEDIILLNITPEVIRVSIILLENHRLRTLDALHLACALEWRPDLFVSSDKKQTAAAQKSGLRIRFIA